MRVDPRSLQKLVLWAAGLAFLGSILWSMWAETLRPLIDAGDRHGVTMHLIGLPLVLGGAGLVVWGGVRLVLDTSRTTQDPTHQAIVTAVREGTPEDARAARRQNFRLLRGVWKRGALLMLAGFALIALGNYVLGR